MGCELKRARGGVVNPVCKAPRRGNATGRKKPRYGKTLNVNLGSGEGSLGLQHPRFAPPPRGALGVVHFLRDG